jgi:hypothetical protein
MPKLDTICRDNQFMKRYLAMQMTEVKEHEYFIKEKYFALYHKEIGELNPDNVFEHWTKYDYGNHFRERFEKHYSQHVCGNFCNYQCPGVKDGGCKLTMKQIHELLEDGPGLPDEEKRELFSDSSELELLLGK